MSWSDDRLYFDTILIELGKEVRRQTGDDGEWLLARVRDRMFGLGARQYGERAFLDRDNLPEGEDEAADLIAYPLFELRKQTLSPTGMPGEAAQALFDAMVKTVEAAQLVRHARYLMRHNP